MVAALRRLERREPRSQIGDFPAQLGDLSALVDEFGGDATQRDAESSSAKLGAESRQIRVVVRNHGPLVLPRTAVTSLGQTALRRIVPSG